ncbi:MAG: hypothetical protein VYB37_01200 [Pseudomonadota bacterium]|nr:hypothetical protein [Pseudomonadota bacterium]
MTRALSKRNRDKFRCIADMLIPEAEGMPSASQVAVHLAGIDHIRKLRPELDENLCRGLDAVADMDCDEAIAYLNAHDPSALGVIALAATSAYYLVPAVQQRLGYPGQLSRPATDAEEGDYFTDDLLQPVINRGPIYRKAPR